MEKTKEIDPELTNEALKQKGTFQIILKDNEIFSNKILGHKEFDQMIIVEGNNVIIEDILIYSPVNNFLSMIDVKGNNCLIRNCRFQEITKDGTVIYIDGRNCVIRDNFFDTRSESKGKNTGIYINDSSTLIYNNRFDEYWCTSIHSTCSPIIFNNNFFECKNHCIFSKGGIIAYNLFKDYIGSRCIGVTGDSPSIIGNVFESLKLGVKIKNGIIKKNLFYTNIDPLILINTKNHNSITNNVIVNCREADYIKVNKKFLQDKNIIDLRNNKKLKIKNLVFKFDVPNKIDIKDIKNMIENQENDNYKLFEEEKKEIYIFEMKKKEYFKAIFYTLLITTIIFKLTNYYF